MYNVQCNGELYVFIPLYRGAYKKKKKKIIAREKRNTSVRNFESRFNREEGEEEEKSA